MKISSVMSPCPYKISVEAKVTDGLRMMRELGIRHLPVINEENVVGVLSESEALMVQFGSKNSDREPVLSDWSWEEPLIVQGDTETADVVHQMAEKKIECALVADSEDLLVGIFTTVDVCRLAYLLLTKE